MLKGFMESRNAVTREVFSKQEVVGNATTVFGAGSDTTALGMIGFFYFLLRNPEVYRNVLAELDEARANGVIRRGEGGVVTYAEGTKLEYLQACLKESMRLLTPVGMEMPRFVPPPGLLVSSKSYFLPGGTEVGAAAFTFHRATEVYGSDAGVFRPERWIGVNEEEKVRLERNYMVVSPGRCSLFE